MNAVMNEYTEKKIMKNCDIHTFFDGRQVMSSCNLDLAFKMK